MFHVPENYRITQPNHPLSSDSSYGNVGAFKIHTPFSVKTYMCIASDEKGWEHVSVSLYVINNANHKTKQRIPSWDDMCFIKSLFWDEDDTVLQLHPMKSEYVNINPNVLHLWRKENTNHELPPIIMV